MCLYPVYLKDKEIWCDCRQCPECRHKRAREWACRCWAQLQESEKGAFITLTYDDAHNPVLLDKKAVQLFIKRLRKRIAPVKIKYFACGEYGDKTLRPHFHLLIFGYDFPDKQYFSKSKKGKIIYISQELQELWQFGLHSIQDITVSSAIYTALYSAKPTNILPDWLQGAPEFNTMSQGLGVDYLLKNAEQYLKTDAIWIDGESYSIPAAVLDKIDMQDDEKKAIKEARAEQYKKRYPEHFAMLDALTSTDKKLEKIVTYDRLVQHEKEKQAAAAAAFAKLYRARKKIVDKEL